MSATTGYYWIVQYCPDLARLETVNVGVVLLVPERGFLRAAVSPSNRRAMRWFGAAAAPGAHMDALKESVINGLALSAGTLRGPQDVEDFLRLRADEIVVTAARTVRVDDPAATLSDLLAELVEEPQPQPAASDPAGAVDAA
jgi:hypothetical protein